MSRIIVNWKLVTLVGLLSGFAAGVIDIATKWLSDLKFGYCKDAVFYRTDPLFVPKIWEYNNFLVRKRIFTL